MEWEAEFLLWLEQFRNPILNQFWIYISYVGLVLLFIPLAITILQKKTRLKGIYMGLTYITPFLVICVLLKAIIHRTRPFVTWTMLHPVVYPIDTSFPSGHTFTAFMLAFLIYRFYNKKLGIACIVMACLIALSRLMLGVHYPTDVLAGFAFALLFFWLSVKYVYPRIEKMKK